MGWDRTLGIQNRNRRQTEFSLKKKWGSGLCLRAGRCVQSGPWGLLSCAHTSQQGPCLTVVAGLPLQLCPTSPWRGDGRRGAAVWACRRLPDTEMSRNGNHLSLLPLRPFLLLFLPSPPQQSMLQASAGLFLNAKIFLNNCRKK